MKLPRHALPRAVRLLVPCRRCGDRPKWRLIDGVFYIKHRCRGVKVAMEHTQPCRAAHAWRDVYGREGD